MKKLASVFLLMSASGQISALTQNGFEMIPYGFIRASTSYSDAGLGSFNNNNMVAPTHAIAQIDNASKDSRMSFQAQQTRIGVDLKKDKNISAKLEFDFVDFNKSSPTTQMNPRVRIASVTYEFEEHKFIIGQDWDLFSPVGAFTYNYVGNYFLAGNTGFMRQQIQYLNTQGEWEFGGALGMAGSNPGVMEGDLELSKSPSYALRAIRKIAGKGRVGISGIYARSHFEVNNSSHDSYSGNLFYEQTFGRISLKSEFYFAQNLANLGALSIGKGTSTDNVKEHGGFLSASLKLTEKSVATAGIGFASVDNEKSVTPFTAGASASTGILNNTVARLGYEYMVTADLSVLCELSRYETELKLASKNKMFIAHQVDAGILLRF